MGCLVELFLMNKGVVEKYDEVRRVLRERWRARERAQRGCQLRLVCMKRKSQQEKAESSGVLTRGWGSKITWIV